MPVFQPEICCNWHANITGCSTCQMVQMKLKGCWKGLLLVWKVGGSYAFK